MSSMNKEQMKEYLDKRGIEYDGRSSEEKLMALCLEHQELFAAKQKVAIKAITESPTASEQIKKGVPVFKQHTNTEEDVRKAAAKYLDREGFVAIFRTDEESGASTWHFKFNGKEDCGNMQIPLRVIVERAEMVARGAIRPRSLKGDGTYKGYADNILMS